MIEVLNALRARTPNAVAAAESYLVERARRRAQEWNETRTQRELKQLDADTTQALVVVDSREQDRFDAEKADKLAEAERQRAQRVVDRQRLADVVDVTQLRTSNDPAELLRLVADADAANAEAGISARAIVLPRLRQLALESRNQIGSPAFKALCRLTEQVPLATASRSDLEERYARRKREAHALVRSVANVIGLGPAFDAATTRAAVIPSPQERSGSGLQVGPAFDLIAQMQQRRAK